MKISSLNFTGYETVWDYPQTNKPTPLSKVNKGGVKPSASSHLQSKTFHGLSRTAPGTVCAFFSCFTHHNSSHLGVDFFHSSAKNMPMYDRCCATFA